MLIILFERQDRTLQTFSFDKGNSALDKCPRVLTKNHVLPCFCESREEAINIFRLLLSKPVRLILSNFEHQEYILTSFKELIMIFSWMKDYLNIFVGFLTQHWYFGNGYSFQSLDCQCQSCELWLNPAPHSMWGSQTSMSFFCKKSKLTAPNILCVLTRRAFFTLRIQPYIIYIKLWLPQHCKNNFR